MENQSIINDIINFLNDRFNDNIPNIIFFIIGMFIGIVIFIIVILIISLIYKLKNKYYKKKIKPLKIDLNYKNIIKDNKLIYINKYKNLQIKEKLTGIGNIMLNMMEDISSLYYPNSKDPIFELSIDQLVDFLSYFSIRLEDFIDNLLDNRLHFVNVITKYSIKDKKLSFVIELINKNNKENATKKISKLKTKFNNFTKNVAFKYGNAIIDKEFISIIDSIGEDINNLYSKNQLNFNTKNKRKLKLERKGDNHD